MDLIVAGGVELMSLITIGSAAIVGAKEGFGSPRGGTRWRARYGDQEISQFRGAEMIAEEWGITREEMEPSRWRATAGRRGVAAGLSRGRSCRSAT